MRTEIEKFLTMSTVPVTAVNDAHFDEAQVQDEERGAEMCAICVHGCRPGELTLQTMCGHQFHSYCLWRWIDTKLDEGVKEGQQAEHPGLECI